MTKQLYDYLITEEGKIYSLKKNTRTRTPDNEVLSHSNSKGYLQLTVTTPDGKKKQFVHRLVAMAFHPNPDNLPEVNHKDGDRQNNHKDNLEWCTRLYNIKHSIESNLKPMGEKHPYSKWTNKQIEEVRNLLSTSTFTIAEISDKTGVSKNSVYKEKYGKGRKT
jgi:hypothetical protein